MHVKLNPLGSEREIRAQGGVPWRTVYGAFISFAHAPLLLRSLRWSWPLFSLGADISSSIYASLCATVMLLFSFQAKKELHKIINILFRCVRMRSKAHEK